MSDPTAPARFCTTPRMPWTAFSTVAVMVCHTARTVPAMAFQAAVQSCCNTPVTKSARPRSTASTAATAPPAMPAAVVTAPLTARNTWLNTGPKVAASQEASGARALFHSASTRFATAPRASVSCCHKGSRQPDHNAPSWAISPASTGCTVPFHSAVSRAVRFWKASATPSSRGWP